MYMQEATDEMLVMRALEDDKQAFELLIERYQTMALFLALRYVGDREIARELLQEALLQAYLSLRRLQEPARFRSWVYGIVLNLCRSWRRDQARMPDMQDLSQAHEKLLEADPQEIVEQSELRQALREAIDVLLPNNRAVALLFYYEDCSIQSIARLLCISPTAVRNRLLKGREQLRTHLRTIYPDMLVATPRRYRRTKMVPMTVARVQQQEKLLRTMVILVDEARQRGLLLWFMTERDFSSQMLMTMREQQKSAVTEPHTTDFILDILRVLQGALEKVEIHTLYDDILYVHVKLRGPDGALQNVKARLENALPLVIESGCPVVVAEDILERQSIKLADFGETFEQQLDAVMRYGQQMPRLAASQTISTVKMPRNLDFAEGFQGWSLVGYPKTSDSCEYQLDTGRTYKNKISLALTLHQQKQAAEEAYLNSFAYLLHEGFIADDYRGKRLRMVAYACAEDVKQGFFNLHITGPLREGEGMERRSMYMTSNQHEPMEGTSDWKRYELVIDVPEDAMSIQCGFNLMGSGKVWMDGFQFEVVDVNVPLTGTRVIPPPQTPVNLAFERGFDGWLVAGGCPQDYKRNIELTEHGTFAASLKSSVERPRGNVVLQQTINAYDYRGKTVRLLATLRAQDIIEQATLYLTSGLIGKTRIERTIEGTTDWQIYGITLRVPDEPGQIEFGLAFYGPGQVWLRDIQFSARQLD